MRTQLDALMALLRRVMVHVGWRLDQSGSGTQIGQVRRNGEGNVRVRRERGVTPQHCPGNARGKRRSGEQASRCRESG